jgi:hypothetical protein
MDNNEVIDALSALAQTTRLDTFRLLALPIHDDLRFRGFAAFGPWGRRGSFGFFTA